MRLWGLFAGIVVTLLSIPLWSSDHDGEYQQGLSQAESRVGMKHHDIPSPKGQIGNADGSGGDKLFNA